MPRFPERPHPDSHIPLTPVELLVLTMLTAGDRHGYGIRQDVLEHTNGEIALEAGNLYRTVRRLENDGLVEPGQPPSTDPHADPRRIYYHLTPSGRRVLAVEMRRLRSLVRLAEERRVIAPVSR